MKVTYIDHMGDDDRVVDAARVSFDKMSEQYSEKANEKLIKFLADHDHWSPFAHCFLTVQVEAPIFVARQLVKHTVGFSWNEVSARYVQVENQFFVPKSWRQEATTKQGRGEHLDEDYLLEYHLDNHYDDCEKFYQFLINKGVAREQARMVLPLGTYTKWYWSGSLAAWARMCSLRMKEDAQAETAEIAEQVASIVSEKFPKSWRYLNG